MKKAIEKGATVKFVTGKHAGGELRAKVVHVWNDKRNAAVVRIVLAGGSLGLPVNVSLDSVVVA